MAIVESVREHRSVTAIAEENDVSRRRVYRALEPLAEVGFVQNDDGFRLTAAAERLLAVFRTVERTVERSNIYFLAGSVHRRSVLDALSASTQNKRDLLETDTGPSRTTVHRIVMEFEGHGWVQLQDDGRLELTDRGASVTTNYRELVQTAEQAIEKGPLLRELDPDLPLPLPILDGLELVTERGDEPFALLEASMEAADIGGEGADHLRSIVPFFSSVMFGEFESLVHKQTTFEVIYTQHAYRQLTRPRNARYLATSLLAPNVKIRVYPKSPTWGLSLYDDMVMLASSIESNDQAAVVGETPDFTEWANETFDTFWAASERPTARFKRWVGRTVSPP